MADIDIKKIRKALEEATKYKKKYEDLLSGKAVSEQILESVSENLATVLEPVLNEMVENAKTSNESLVSGIKDAFAGRETNEGRAIVAALQAGFRGIRFPTPKIEVKPTFTAPEVTPFVMPETIRAVLNYDAKNPLPVMLMGLDGKPFQFSSSAGGGAAGGRGDFFTIQGFGASAYASMQNADGRLRVSVETGGSGLTDSELRAAHLDVQQVSGAIDSVFVTGSSGTLAAALVDSSGAQFSGSNPLPVTFAAAGFQNVAMYDAQQSSVTSHTHPILRDFRGLDMNLLGILNVESALNSSATTLGIGGEFTGLPEEVLNYGSMTFMVISDAASSTNGFVVQQSADGTNWDISDSYTVPAATGKVFSIQPAARYMRIFYANGAAAQTSFRMFTYLHYVPAQPSSQRTADGYSNEADLQQFWGFMSMFNGLTWDRLRSNVGDSAGALRVTYATDAAASVSISGSTGTTAAYNLNGDGLYRDTFPVSGSVVVSSVTATTSTRLDSPDGPYSAANPFPVTLISGALTSTIAVGDIPADGADTGSSPLKIGGIARTTNPGAVSDGDRVSTTHDDVGRPVFRPMQVRDLTKTAYVTLSTGTETTLLAGVAGAFLDLIYVMGANTSSAAVQVDIRAVTAGNVVATLYIPANSTAGVALPVAWPQDATGNNWTVDMGDFTNSNVLISALFSQEA